MIEQISHNEDYSEQQIDMFEKLSEFSLLISQMRDGEEISETLLKMHNIISIELEEVLNNLLHRNGDGSSSA